ncbi:MAG: hypothetical protein JNM63_07550, partial [Spirochaetia bacterium]|nr:hypothetical protein [Spirochaetia bacterium]
MSTLLLAKPGAYKSIGSGWAGLGDMTSINGKMYVINGGTLYETTTDGKYKDLGGGWKDLGGMAALDGKLYLISG